MKAFILFLFYMLLTCTYATVLCLIEVFRCFVFEARHCYVNWDPSDTPQALNDIVISFGMFLTVVVGFLCLAVFISQI